MNVISINLDNLSKINEEYLSKNLTVLYGAGGNGAKLLEIFRQNNIKIDLFCDDDFNKWGKKYHEVDVVSYEKFVEILQGESVDELSEGGG